MRKEAKDRQQKLLKLDLRRRIRINKRPAREMGEDFFKDRQYKGGRSPPNSL